MTNTHCICTSGKVYKDCCQPFHLRLSKPKTCEQLMRSRYSAFCLQLGEYLFTTYHPNFRGDLTIEQLSEKSLDWTDLEIISSESVKETGYVEFKASFMIQGQVSVHHERSNFVKECEQWLYCDGTFYS